MGNIPVMLRVCRLSVAEYGNIHARGTSIYETLLDIFLALRGHLIQYYSVLPWLDPKNAPTVLANFLAATSK